jgi:hypothetical protein
MLFFQQSPFKRDVNDFILKLKDKFAEEANKLNSTLSIDQFDADQIIVALQGYLEEKRKERSLADKGLDDSSFTIIAPWVETN